MLSTLTTCNNCECDFPFLWKVSSGGELLPINSLKWNPNDVLTTYKAISKGLASRFVYWSCALRQKPKINGFEKEQKHGGRRQDCFSLLYFGNSQICWFYVAFQTWCVWNMQHILIAPQGCQLSRIIWETPDFKPFLPVSRLDSEISRIMAEVCHFL